ncbi:hypothetical protein VPHK406_0153 [Vibrio phage K406]
METRQFVQQLNYPSRKIDGNFLLSTTPERVREYIVSRQVEIDKHNSARQELIECNRTLEESLLKHLLEVVKIDQWKIFKQKKRGNGWAATTVRGDMYVHWQKVFADVKTYIPSRLSNVVDLGSSNAQYELTYNNVSLKVSISRPHTLEDIFELSKNEIKRYEDSVAKENKLLVASKEFLDRRNEDYSELITGKDIIELADKLAREEYREGVFEGSETITVQHSDGDDCEWDGDHRCECGNNRYYLEIEGDLINGYYSWGQWC